MHGTIAQVVCRIRILSSSAALHFGSIGQMALRNRSIGYMVAFPHMRNDLSAYGVVINFEIAQLSATKRTEWYQNKLKRTDR